MTFHESFSITFIIIIHDNGVVEVNDSETSIQTWSSYREAFSTLHCELEKMD